MCGGVPWAPLFFGWEGGLASTQGIQGDMEHPSKSATGAEPSALVLGAGLAGLSVALSLVRRGWSVTVLERAGEVGGLARTIRLAPDQAFDLGGHRLLSRDPDLLRQLRGLLDGELIEVPRRSHICLGGRFFRYPLKPAQAFLSFGPRVALRIGRDYAWGHLRSLVRRGEEETFEEWALNRFGRSLYEIFFKPYTEKVWGMEARGLSADWARERIDLMDLLHALLRAVFPSRGARPRTYATRFLYPRRGIGRIAERLAQEVERLGGRILCQVELKALERSTGRVTRVLARAGDEAMALTASRVISSIPITEWCKLLSPAPPSSVQEAASRLCYRHMIFVYLLLSGPGLTRDTWVYLPDPHLRICRIHEPRNWSPELAPAGRTSLCAEVFSERDEGLWLEPDPSMVQLAVEELCGLGLLEGSRVLDSKVLRVPFTHPVYSRGFRGDLQIVKGFASAEMANFHLLGRTGAFEYKDMDQVMADGFRLGELLSS